MLVINEMKWEIVECNKNKQNWKKNEILTCRFRSLAQGDRGDASFCGDCVSSLARHIIVYLQRT